MIFAAVALTAGIAIISMASAHQAPEVSLILVPSPSYEKPGDPDQLHIPIRNPFS